MKNTTVIKSFLLFQVLLFISCQREEPQLVNWSKEFVADGMELERNDIEIVKEDYFSVQINGDTIIATTLILDVCVDEAVGQIEFKKGTIRLTSEVTMAAEQYCPVYYKYRYVIYNPSGVDYEIVGSEL